MKNTDYKTMLLEWANQADEGEDVSLDGETLRELAGLIPVSALPEQGTRYAPECK